MGLRTRLLVNLALVVIIGIGLACFTVYEFARNRLETAARTQLEQAASMLARQSEAWLDKFKSDVALWADLPIVRQMAREPGNSSKAVETCRYFERIVETGGIYQSVNLHNTSAVCIASSMASRIGREHMQQFVAMRPDFQKAVGGKASISPTIVSMGTGRPCSQVTPDV